MSFSLGKLASQLAVLSFGRVLGAVCVFLVSLLIARHFGATTLADYSLLISVASILSVLFPIGFHAIATLFTSEYRAKGAFPQLAAFIDYARRLTLSTALFCLFAALFVFYLAPTDTGYDINALVLLSVPTAFAMANIYLNSALLIGLEKHYWAHLPDMVLRPVLLLMGLGILILALPMVDDRAVLMLLCGAVFITMALQWVALRGTLSKLFEKTAKLEDTKEEQKRWWHLAPDHMKITLLWDYFFELHILMAGFLLMPDQVALLFVCFRIRQLAGFGMRSIYALLMPKVFAANALEDKRHAQHTVTQSVRLTFTYAAITWVVFFYAGPLVLAAFGEEFSDGQLILMLLLANMIVRAVFGPAAAVLGMHRHAKLVVKILFASLCISLSITFMGSFLFADIAIPIAYLIATTFSAGALWWLARKRTGMNCAIWSKG